MNQCPRFGTTLIYTHTHALRAEIGLGLLPRTDLRNVNKIQYRTRFTLTVLPTDTCDILSGARVDMYRFQRYSI
jgi:hypothetical protein